MSGITGQSVDSWPRPVFQGQSLLMTGFNPDVDLASVPEDVWPIGGLIVFASTAGLVSVVSTSANDAAAGTGAQQLILNGVDANLVEITEVVVLNGLTPVLTISDFLHVQTASVIAAGSGLFNAGVITFTIDGGVVNGIAIGKSQTQSAARIIPDTIKPGTICHLVNAFALCGKQQTSAVTATLVVTPTTGAALEALDIPLVTAGGAFVLDLHVPALFSIGSRVVIRVTEVSANDTLVSAGLQFVWL